MPMTTSIIDALGISWRLQVQEFAVLSYSHPEFGSLEYTGLTEFIPANVNTLHLTSQGSLPDGVLPKNICVRPKYDAVCGCYDVTEYDPPEAACLCKDPGCPCIEQKICLECTIDGITSVECCEGQACIGREGVNAPAGPSRELCCTLLGVNVCGVWYCDASGQWWVDIYCDDVLTASNEISHSGCPLVLGTTSFGGCPGCTVTTPVVTACCPDDAIPPTLFMSFTGCRTATATLTWDGSGWEGFDSEGVRWTLVCFGVVWLLLGQGCSFTTMSFNGCATPEWSFVYDAQNCPLLCGVFTAVITA